MARTKTTTATRRATVTEKQANEFMVKLFDLIPDAEMDDPEMARLEKRAMRENWNRKSIQYRAAKAEKQAAACRRLLAGGFRPFVESSDFPAHVVWVFAVHRMILTPAPSRREMEWKRPYIGMGSAFLSADAIAAQKKAIASDEMRFGESV